MAELSPDQMQAAIYVVVGIIILEGIWLVYLTYMLWKRKEKSKSNVETQPEGDAPIEEKDLAKSGETQSKETFEKEKT
jgi:hypothetical protein